MEISIFLKIMPCSSLEVNQISEEYIVSIFKVENKQSKKPAWKQVSSRTHSQQNTRRYIPDNIPFLTTAVKISGLFVFSLPKKQTFKKYMQL
jgi:hypothetical protein